MMRGMPRPLPNLHHLELFYHVAKAGGITAAVRAMPYGIQQPAVSGQIGRLEEELGVRLFQRRPFRLTAAGRELYEFAAPFFGGLGEVSERVAGRAARHLRMAAPATVVRDHLPAVLERVRRKLPELELTLRDADQRTVFDLLEREEVDLAVAELEGRPPAGVRSEVLLSLPLELWCPEELDEGGLAEWCASQPLIRTPEDTAVTRLFQKGMTRKKLSWPARIEVGSLDLVLAYVARGFGVGLGVRVPGMTPPKGVRAVPLDGFPELKIAGLWRGKPGPLAAAVVEELRKRSREIG